MSYTITNFAAAYGSCGYGQTNFNDSSATCSTSGGGSSSSNSAGGLTNTGFDIVLAVTIACVIIFAALVVRFVRKPKKSAKNTTATPTPQNPTPPLVQ